MGSLEAIFLRYWLCCIFREVVAEYCCNRETRDNVLNLFGKIISQTSQVTLDVNLEVTESNLEDKMRGFSRWKRHGTYFIMIFIYVKVIFCKISAISSHVQATLVTLSIFH